jgi:hypothetical protein
MKSYNCGFAVPFFDKSLLLVQSLMKMDYPSPQAGSGIRGRMERVWWMWHHRERFAVTVENVEDNQILWILWFHWCGQWVYWQEEEVARVWTPLQGDIQGVAWFEGGSWILYFVFLEEEREEACPLLVLNSSLCPNWET